MGTLTGTQTRLPGQCEHKLPTSCRLTSILNCCACADERPHAASYSTYVDGLGFVPWGTRWQRYCWYCREFWAKRVGVSGLRPALTRVPEVPEQREFLERWEEFHRGFRVVVGEGGGEERVAVLGEDWREVDPGCLPRTLEELRAGRAASEVVTQRVVQVEAQEEERPGQTLEDTLDQMFQEAEGEDAAGRVPTQPARPGARPSGEVPSLSIHDMLSTAGGRDAQRDAQARPNNIHAQAMVPAVNRNREYQARRIAALRRELHRMRNGIERVISGLRDLGEAVPEHAEATNRLTELGSTLDEIGGIPSREDELHRYYPQLYLHWWDFTTFVPEIMTSLNSLADRGKVLYLGISDTPAWLVSKANQYARDHGLRPFIVYQGRWSAALRDFERDIIPMCEAEGMGIAPWGVFGFVPTCVLFNASSCK
ncbi:hypothetical protein LTR91_019080 [Friedmanniomyces endolithicus]|uniref:NADP-dependent oxidoreductase domain-containing protein n=1 Tax=Friedmanniomyces endolithicus TaxID=329885 RepID=A0AAN6K1P2_9PEZI|nr:hypothetical protein LTR57_019736 [Friedmanniomyces endolithicus]KAK0956566.1 hypothetical protein LTS01_022783 [Friedmanniomyces endolithicus]KAK0963215.1 hypothetical protein LTR91_019080 [Friedmanniomyces endolithicus]KAK1026859.1 hypothetical protein LTS16_021964 [Friedmanniomyces endolithicus]